MIAVDIQGRLGNQLFEYAFAYSVSKAFHTICLFDHSKQFIVPIFFRVGRFPVYVNRIPFIRRLYRRMILDISHHNSVDWNNCLLLHDNNTLTDSTYYSGFFQSVLYDIIELTLVSQYLFIPGYGFRKLFGFFLELQYLKSYKL